MNFVLDLSRKDCSNFGIGVSVAKYTYMCRIVRKRVVLFIRD